MLLVHMRMVVMVMVMRIVRGLRVTNLQRL